MTMKPRTMEPQEDEWQKRCEDLVHTLGWALQVLPSQAPAPVLEHLSHPGLKHQGVQAQLDERNGVEHACAQTNRSSGSRNVDTTETMEHGADPHDREGRRTLLLAYYPRDTGAEELECVFQKFGRVVMVNLVGNKVGKPLCYGFLRFAEAFAAEKAWSECQMGRVIMHDSAGKAWHLKAEWAKRGFGKKSGGGKHSRRSGQQPPP